MLTSRKIGGGPACCERAGSASSAIAANEEAAGGGTFVGAAKDHRDGTIGGTMSPDIRTAFVDYPTRSDGSQWDQTYKELAECQMLANAVLIALNKKGFAITKVV